MNDVCLYACAPATDGMLAWEEMGSDTEQRRVAVYCRVSTLLEEQENSYETQQEAFMQRIGSDSGLQLAGIYGDRGRTGTSIKLRPDFQRLIRDCEDGKIEIKCPKMIQGCNGCIHGCKCTRII